MFFSRIVNDLHIAENKEGTFTEEEVKEAKREIYRRSEKNRIEILHKTGRKIPAMQDPDAE